MPGMQYPLKVGLGRMENSMDALSDTEGQWQRAMDVWWKVVEVQRPSEELKACKGCTSPRVLNERTMAVPLHLKRTQAGIVVNVHPVVVLSICDAHTRRNTRERVIGTILGSMSDNQYNVTSCFVVPHTETSDQVSIDTSHHSTLLDLHSKVYPKDSVLGWFSSSVGLQGVDSLIQDFYHKIVRNPIRLSVDTKLESDGAKVAAQVSRPLILKEIHVATEFVEVACRVQMEHVESVGLHMLQSGRAENAASGTENLVNTLKKLTRLVGDAHDYVESVVEGRRKGDAVVGRYLLDTLAVVPFVDKTKFEEMFHDRMQELILVLYLANLSKTQIAIADRLASKTP